MSVLESLVVMNNYKICKSAHFLPDKIMTNDDYASYLDTSDEWIYKRTGIKERHINQGEITGLIDGLLTKVQLSNEELSNLGAIIVASSTNLNIMPNIASYVHGKINAPEEVLCLDVNSACSGFVAALSVARGLFNGNQNKRVLVVGVDQMSSIVDSNDRNTCILFGDGAGLMLLESTNNQHVLMQHSTCEYNEEALNLTNGFIQMRGQDVFKYAVNDVVKHINHLLNESKLTLKDLNYVVCHQANERILMAIRRQFNLDEEQVLSTIAQTANTSSASIPICWDLHKERFKTGDKIIMIGFGAGLITNSILYEI